MDFKSLGMRGQNKLEVETDSKLVFDAIQDYERHTYGGSTGALVDAIKVLLF